MVQMQDKRVGKNPAGFLVKSIEDDYAAPKGFIPRAERQRLAEVRCASERKAAEERRQKHEAAAREQAEQKALDAHFQKLSPDDQARVDAEALAAAGKQAQETYATLKQLTGNGSGYLATVRRDYLRKQLQAEGKPILSEA